MINPLTDQSTFLSHYISLMPMKDPPRVKKEGPPTKRPWTYKDWDYLKINYVSKGRKHCAEALNRTEDAIKNQATVKGYTSHVHWSQRGHDA